MVGITGSLVSTLRIVDSDRPLVLIYNTPISLCVNVLLRSLSFLLYYLLLLVIHRNRITYDVTHDGLCTREPTIRSR